MQVSMKEPFILILLRVVQVMPYCPGGDLYGRVERTFGGLTPTEARLLFGQMIRGLLELRDMGLAHGYVKFVPASCRILVYADNGCLGRWGIHGRGSRPPPVPHCTSLLRMCCCVDLPPVT
jgi:serine/threonine protein kinase